MPKFLPIINVLHCYGIIVTINEQVLIQSPYVTKISLVFT